METSASSHESLFTHIAVFGLGLIGASLAANLKQVYPETTIVGVDIDPAACAIAAQKGWVDQSFLQEDEGLKDFVCNQADLAFIATPVPAVPVYLKMLADWGYEGLITDTASTKAHISEVAAQVLHRPENYIPGHPMAGSEVNGIQGANPDLFKGAHWILCPDAHTPAERFTQLHELITGMGARVVSLPREQHDQSVAIVSHVPHIVASSLMHLACRHADDQQALMRLAAGGFKDSTRIAAGSPKLWCGIALDNAQAITAGLDEMRQIIGSFIDAIDAADKEKLTKLLADASDARRAIPAAWVPATEDLLEVRVPMSNRSGVVAEVTTIASSVGCNIQSIEIDHVTADSAVLSMVFTDEGDIGKLSTSLIKAGYTFSFNPLGAKEHSHVE